MVLQNLTIIAAIGKGYELGYKNDLIWTFREDLKTFKEITMGKYIVMGENTYRSLPVRLVGRKYLVLSNNLKDIEEGQVFGSLDQFLSFARNTHEEIFVCGGGMVYALLLPYTNKMILTEIEDEFPDATVHFPRFDKDEWDKEKGNILTGTTRGCEISYSRNIYKRIKP